MRAVSVRSGLVETRHEVTVAAVAADGALLEVWGDDSETPFFSRSAVKPWQALVAQQHGADLGDEQLALAMASHVAAPVHIAVVDGMLAEVGLDAGALRCPPQHPPRVGLDRIWTGRGVVAPDPRFYNCSGKHAAVLRACVASGWSLEYTEPDHPIQVSMLRQIERTAGFPAGPVGVDGCGLLAPRTTVVALARMFAALAVDPELARIASVAHRLAPLMSDGRRPDAELARWANGAAKSGAEGCMGFGWFGGIGVAAKAWSGDRDAASLGVVAMLRHLGVLPDHPYARLVEAIGRPAMGGVSRVGSLRWEDHG